MSREPDPRFNRRIVHRCRYRLTRGRRRGTLCGEPVDRGLIGDANNDRCAIHYDRRRFP